MTGIRKAAQGDATAIADLLEQLDYLAGPEQISTKLAAMLGLTGLHLLVYEQAGEVVAFLAMQVVPQIALEKDLALITYFVVAGKARGARIGAEMETYVSILAEYLGCEQIGLHCHVRRMAAHRFYERQGYEETRKYYTKTLTNNVNNNKY